MNKVSGYIYEIRAKEAQNHGIVQFWGSVLSEEDAIKEVDKLNNIYSSWIFFYDAYWIGEKK